MSRRTPKFSTRTPEEDVSRLDPSESANASPEETSKFPSWRPDLSFKLSPPSGSAEQQRHSLPSDFFSGIARLWNRDHDHGAQQETQEGALAHTTMEPGPLRDASMKDKSGHKHHTTDHHHAKLGTYSGVFVPTTLNVLSILMFLRFSFILGQSGVLGMLGKSFLQCVERLLRNSSAARLLYDQSRDNNVALCHCNEWNRTRWRRLLPGISISWP